MRSDKSELDSYRLYPNDTRKAISPSETPKVYQGTRRRLPSSLCKPSLRTYFDWDDSGNDDYAARPVILDLFCGGGGAGVGYYDAGFRVVGVDIKPMPRYPFEFHQADALEYCAAHGAEFCAIHASPPCQGYSTQLNCWPDKKYPMLIKDTRHILESLNIPFIIENVMGARNHMRSQIILCGKMFDLKVYRHRYFESNFLLFQPYHVNHNDSTPRAGHGISPNGFLSVTGHAGFAGETELRKQAMGIDWMTGDELSEAIPPAYTEFIGAHLLKVVTERR